MKHPQAGMIYEKGAKRAYPAYSELAKAADEEPMEEEEYKEFPDKEEESGDDENVEKSARRYNLRKSVTAFTALLALGAAAPDRQTELAQKLAKSQISDGEREELTSLLKNGAPGASGLRKSFREQVEAQVSSETTNAINGSEFLIGVVGGIETSLNDLGKSVGAGQRQTFDLVKGMGHLMAQMAGEMDALAKSNAALERRLRTVERTPGAPRATQTAGTGTPRSPGGTVNGGDNPEAGKLTKAEVGTGLLMLTKAASDAEDDNAMARLTQDTASFESGFGISKSTAAAIYELKKANPAGLSLRG